MHAGSRGRRRYAIIGGGFAGVATAWHLLAAGEGSIAGIDLFDAAGLGGGASGAAAGLLHPYTPKGKVRGFHFPAAHYNEDCTVSLWALQGTVWPAAGHARG